MDGYAAVIESVAISNLNAIASQPAMLSNLALSNAVAMANLSMQNAVAHQQALNQIGVAILGRCVNGVTNLGPVESASASKVYSDDAVAAILADLKAAIQALLASSRN